MTPEKILDGVSRVFYVKKATLTSEEMPCLSMPVFRYRIPHAQVRVSLGTWKADEIGLSPVFWQLLKDKKYHPDSDIRNAAIEGITA